MKDYDDGFSAGVCLALQIMNAAGDMGSADYEELFRCAGPDKVLSHARREGIMRMTGLDRYTRHLKEHAAIAASREVGA